MNGDDMSGETNSGDDFWGGTPDWTDAPARPRREKRSGGKRSGDVTGAIKGLWASAMTAGADATREHRVIDAATPPPKADAVGPNMFDDIGDDFHFDTGSVADNTFDQSEASTTNATGEVPIVDVFDEATLAVVAPVSMSERQDDRRRSGAIDPLLVRLGAVAIATTLLVPLAIGLSAGADDSDTLTSASASAEAATAAPTFDTAPATDVSGPVADSAAATPAGLDPDSLPPAVPVDQGSTSTSASSGDSSADDDTSGDLAVESAASELDDSTDSSDSNGSLSTSDAMQADAATNATGDGVDEAASADDGAERVTNCAIDYTVVGGDFWLRLAAAADVSLAELLEANGASVNTPLYPGSEICLPAGATTPAPPAAETDSTTPATPTTAAPTPTTAPPTTAPPTTAAPTTTAAPDPTPNTDATPEEVKQIIRDVWPDELEEKALEIAFRESRYAPTAKNYCCYGLFQIYWSVHQSWLAGIGITDDQQLYDPATNARAAYALYERAGGWGPWSQTNY